MKKLFRKFLCLIGDHDWTCAAEQGIEPTEKQMKAGEVGFRDYATMYCKHCGQVSNLN